LKNFIALILCLFCLGCSGVEIVQDSTAYDAWVDSCKSYQDVEDWFLIHFAYDNQRLAAADARPGQLPIQSPAETFNRKKGICGDASVLVKYALNRINPDYKAEILFLDEPPTITDHYVCVFHMDGKLYVADYGRPASKTTTGPWDNLEDYVARYRMARGKKAENYHYGWPAGSKRYY
jgi:hypothetical protein